MYIFEFKDRFANLCLPDCPSFDDITSGPPISSFHHVLLSLSLSLSLNPLPCRSSGLVGNTMLAVAEEGSKSFKQLCCFGGGSCWIFEVVWW